MSRTKKEGPEFDSGPSRETMDDYWYWAKKGSCSKPELQKERWLWISSKPQDIEKAKIFCEICPVIERCKTYALNNSEPEGVWGGLSVSDRHGLIEQNNPFPIAS